MLECRSEMISSYHIQFDFVAFFSDLVIMFFNNLPILMKQGYTTLIRRANNAVQEHGFSTAEEIQNPSEKIMAIF